jgi:hypothetical protein
MTSIIIFVPCLGGSELVDSNGVAVWPLTTDNYRGVLYKRLEEYILHYGMSFDWSSIKSGAINLWNEFKPKWDFRDINLMPDSLLDLLMSPSTGPSGKIVRKILTIDFYSLIINELAGAGFNENESLFLFGYDFRKSIPVSASRLDTFITSTIEQLTVKGIAVRDVTLIGHGLGCVVMKELIQNHQNNPIIKNKLLKNAIFIGAPTYGTPDALSTICGLGREIFMTSVQLCKVANNFDSIACLVPSKFSLFDVKKGEFLDLSMIKDLTLDPKLRSMIDFEKLKNGYEYARLASDYVLPEFVNVYQLVGSIHEETPCMLKWMGNKFEVEMAPCGGDGVIPFENAINRSKDSFVYFIPCAHEALANDSTTLKIITSILVDQVKLTPFVYYDIPGHYPKVVGGHDSNSVALRSSIAKLSSQGGGVESNVDWPTAIHHDFYFNQKSIFYLDNAKTFYDGQLYTFKFDIVFHDAYLYKVSTMNNFKLQVARVEIGHNSLDVHEVELERVKIKDGSLLFSTHEPIGYGVFIVHPDDVAVGKNFKILLFDGSCCETNIVVGHFITKPII